MKNTKLVATLGAVALVAAVGLGSTLAYLTDTTDTVTNTFTFGNVTFDLDGGLRESEVVRDTDPTSDTYGKYIDNDGDDWTIDDTQGYTDLYPGETVLKDPTVLLDSDSNDAWVYAKVVYDKDLYTIDYSDDWEVIEDLSDDDYDFVAKTDAALAGGENSTIFTAVTVSSDIDLDDEDFEGLTNIEISAAAVQALGFADSEAAQDTASGLFEAAEPQGE